MHDITGFQVFLDPGIKASPADADDFVALAVHALDAAVVFRCPSSEPTLYLAVHDLQPSTSGSKAPQRTRRRYSPAKRANYQLGGQFAAVAGFVLDRAREKGLRRDLPAEWFAQTLVP